MTIITQISRQLMEQEFWIKELRFMCEEITVMQQHLGDLCYGNENDDILKRVAEFEEKFTLQKQWLERMQMGLEYVTRPRETDPLILKTFSLQMQANRIANEELKNNFLELFS